MQEGDRREHAQIPMFRPDEGINRYTEASHHVKYSSRITDSKGFEDPCYEPSTTVDARGVPCLLPTVSPRRPCSPTNKSSTTNTITING